MSIIVSDSLATNPGPVTGRNPDIGSSPWEAIPTHPDAPWNVYAPMQVVNGHAQGTGGRGMSGNVIESGSGDKIVAAKFVNSPSDPWELLIVRYMDSENFIAVLHTDMQGLTVWQKKPFVPGFSGSFGPIQLADNSYFNGFGVKIGATQLADLSVALVGNDIIVTCNGVTYPTITAKDPMASGTKAGIGDNCYGNGPYSKWNDFVVNQ